MKTTKEFNEKYKEFLTEGFYGLAIQDQEVIDYLDDIFGNVLVHLHNFKYQQIKEKWGYVRFYADVESKNLLQTIEMKIKSMLDDRF